jgi:lipopolysaccharide transport system ATP-binding protein
MSVVIRVENLGKCYTLKHQGQGRSGDGLRHALQDAISAPFRRFSSSLRRRRQTDLPTFPPSHFPTSETFWALRDVSFEVRQGDVVGIIGRNGAGKSTLLKILSRITEPSTGRIGLKGRVASLLEVGTGFHPELTGRENIFLNGAILGMSRAEVKGKFDEIVDFSGVEKFLDTPVKRYSSGMYVRLAFAVAAHLEPEILIVDEVLAVGDAEFQKKCLGRMSDVAREGRTVLFVSHNIAAMQRLCSRGIHLRQGRTSGIQSIQSAVSEYVTKSGRSDRMVDLSRHGRPSDWGSLARITSLGFEQDPVYGETWELTMTVECLDEIRHSIVSIGLNTLDGTRALTLDSDFNNKPLLLRKGMNRVQFSLPFNPLHPGPYAAGCSVWSGNHLLDSIGSAAIWEVGAGKAHQFQIRGFGGCRPALAVTNHDR